MNFRDRIACIKQDTGAELAADARMLRNMSDNAGKLRLYKAQARDALTACQLQRTSALAYADARRFMGINDES